MVNYHWSYQLSVFIFPFHVCFCGPSQLLMHCLDDDLKNADAPPIGGGDGTEQPNNFSKLATDTVVIFPEQQKLSSPPTLGISLSRILSAPFAYLDVLVMCNILHFKYVQLWPHLHSQKIPAEGRTGTQKYLPIICNILHFKYIYCIYLATIAQLDDIWQG